MDLSQLAPAVLLELQRRPLHKDADLFVLLEEFAIPGGGGYVLVSDGHGDARMLIPYPAGSAGPAEIEVSPFDNKSNLFAVHARAGTVQVLDTPFAEFTLEVAKYADPVSAGRRPQLAIRGRGPEGSWSPLGFDDSWFRQDLLLVQDLARRGGTELRPDVELDARDPTWLKLEPDEWELAEELLGRRVPGVVHVSLLEEALASGKVSVGREGVRQGLAARATKARGQPVAEPAAFAILEAPGTRRRTAGAYRDSSKAQDEQIQGIVQGTRAMIEKLQKLNAPEVASLIRELDKATKDSSEAYRRPMADLTARLRTAASQADEDDLARSLIVYCQLKAHSDGNRIRGLLDLNQRASVALKAG